MNIHYDIKEGLFHLQHEKMSYCMAVLRTGHLAHLYVGPPLKGPLQVSFFRVDQNKGLTAYPGPGEFGLSLGVERMEYPSFGTSDFREPAIALEAKTGETSLDLRYHSHEILPGKPNLSPMPSTRPHQADEGMTLEIKLFDALRGVSCYLTYTLFKGLGGIVRSARLTNESRETLNLKRLMSLNVDLMDQNWEWVQFTGDWIRERAMTKHPIRVGVQSIGSRRGASSAHQNPFLILKRPHTTEDAGEALGLSLVYSGNFLILGEGDHNGHTRIMAGIHPGDFSWELRPGDSFQTPEAVLVYSQEGLNALSQNLHRFIHQHIIHPKWHNHQRPICLNNWEATYFDFDEEKLIRLAQAGKSLGMEMLVLDDGWFGQRNNDQTSLGDWTVNLKKLPSGLKGLSEKLHDLGMQFGLWIEPEMVNLTSKFALDHPDWIIREPRREPCHARNQYVLDFSRKEVVEAIYEQLTALLDQTPVDYIKWDMNRNMTDVYSLALPPHRQGELHHRYILGVYDLYERLTQRYPHILFESCSAGGGRFDLGMLYYAPQTWTSDNTDAVERLKIQYGTSMAYPLSTMAAHVSQVPNHQTHRVTPLKLRHDVARFGVLGYELDVTLLTEKEKEDIRQEIKSYKTYRQDLLYGDFYRLVSPFDTHGHQTAWMVVAKDQSRAILGWYQVLASPNPPLSHLPLSGLDPLGLYVIDGTDQVYGGADLMALGLLIQPSYNGIHKTNDPSGDYQSRLVVLNRL